MSRPDVISQVADRTVLIAEFHVQEFGAMPLVLRAFAEFQTCAKGLTTVKSYSTFQVYRDKTDDELAETLQREQDSWDRRRDEWNRAMSGEHFESWRLDGINEWARANGQEEVVRADV